MRLQTLLLLLQTAVFCGGTVPDDTFLLGKFPDDFALGVATAAYQIEGAWQADGKGLSIWDTYSHIQGNIENNDNGDIAADHYHHYKEDVQLLRELRVSHFRMSLSWSRIMTDGTIHTINEKGIQHYKDVFRELAKYNITPMVTLYHWDLPQHLQDLGGWENSSMVYYFGKYADLCFWRFGDWVKHWITFNEPFSFLWMGYEAGTFAPGIKDNKIIYKVAHNVIKAHVHAYNSYNSTYKKSDKGKVGITIDTEWKEPVSQSVEDVEAAERAMDFRFGWYAHPLVYGDYPQRMKDQVAKKSRLEGETVSRLPEFTEQEKKEMTGAYDFLGVNHYTSQLITNAPDTDPTPGYFNDQDVTFSFDPAWPGNDNTTMWRTVPWGLRRLLNYIRTNYKNVDVYITENGKADCGTMQDQTRVDYIKGYSNNVLKAIDDGCNVKGYFVWTLMDDFEWSSGYSPKMGFYYVDFNRADRARYPRKSAEMYQMINRERGFTEEIRDFRAFPADRDEFLYGHFPDNFMWGASSSAFQVEGGWNADGKGESIWDRFAHTGRISNGETGDVACDSYHLYKEDVRMLKELGADIYRFSIAWSRILPDGTPTSINSKGIAYYDNLINELLANNIQPVVTIYHWDLPQALQDKGGWLNDDVITWFTKYAEILFHFFGDRVKYWITFNESYVIAWLGYGAGQFAPGVKQPGDGVYRVAHNIIRSHVSAYRLYDQKFRDYQHGKVGITLDIDWKEPFTSSSADRYAAHRALQFKLGWFANAIYNNGDYPEVMKEYIARRSKAEGLSQSRLPAFTDEEKKNNKGSFDYMGINHYSTDLIAQKANPGTEANYQEDQEIDVRVDGCFEKVSSSWLHVNPWGIRRILRYAKEYYGDIPIMITENGASDLGGLEDDGRIKYFTSYINEVLKAVLWDKVNVIGYTAWALMDNLEWLGGTRQKFGLFYVNFTDPARPRIPKKSAGFMTKLIKENGFVKE